MNVLAENFYERKCEIEVLEDIFIMYCLYDTKVLFRRKQSRKDTGLPIYFVYDNYAIDISTTDNKDQMDELPDEFLK